MAATAGVAAGRGARARKNAVAKQTPKTNVATKQNLIKVEPGVASVAEGNALHVGNVSLLLVCFQFLNLVTILETK